MDKIDLLKSLSESQDAVEIATQNLDNAKLVRADLIQQCFRADCTLDVIGEILGVSRQRVKQLLTDYEAKQFRLLHPIN